MATPHTQPMHARIAAASLAAILTASAVPHAGSVALANESDTYAEQRDEANARAEKEESLRDEANERAESAQQQSDDAAARAEEAQRQQDAASAQREATQAELDAANQQLDELYRAHEAALAELGKAEYDLDETRGQIKDLKVRIKENEADLEVSQRHLASHVSAAYRSGSVSLIEIILESTSFDDLVSRIVYNNKIAQDYTNTIDKVKTLQEELTNQREELEAEEQKQAEQVVACEDKERQANDAQVAQQSYIDGLSDELVAAIDAERALEAQKSQARAEQAKADAEAQAARDEAKQREAAAAHERETADEAEQNRVDAEAREKAAEEAAKAAEEAAAAAAAATTEYETDDSEPSADETDDVEQQGSDSSTDDAADEAEQPTTLTAEMRQTAVNAALTQIGVPYGFGCESPGVAFDCNSLTHWAWAQAGVSIPYGSGRTCYGQFQWMQSSGRWVTSVDELQPGDLVFYSYNGGITTYHVALYIGGGQVVHANGYRYGVIASDIFFDSGFCGGGSPL